MDDGAVIKEWKRRRRKGVVIYFIGVIVFAAGLVSLLWATDINPDSAKALLWIAGLILTTGAAILFIGGNQLRCPACKRLLMLNAVRFCTSCGRQLEN
jgi:hypothetical protein